MPLIACPECKREVSDRAASCPQCGCPLSPIPQSRASTAPRQKVNVEQTNKDWKLMKVGSVLLCIIGTVMVFSVPVIGVPLVAFGLILFVWSGVGAWWSNG